MQNITVTSFVEQCKCLHLCIFLLLDMIFFYSVFFCPWALKKIFENSCFEKQLLIPCLLFPLSLAVLSALWRTSIHYLSLAPKNNSCMLVQPPYVMLPPTYWEEQCWTASFTSTHRNLFPVVFRCATFELSSDLLFYSQPISGRSTEASFNNEALLHLSFHHNSTLQSISECFSINGIMIWGEEGHIRI